MDKNIVKQILSYREWNTFECKRALTKPAKMLEIIVAFANTHGGVFVIGLEDPDKAQGEKRLIGINEKCENVSELLQLISREVTPALGDLKHFEIPIINVKGEEDKLLIVFVGQSNDVHSLRSGDTFVRRGDKTVKIGSVEITRLKYEKGSIKFGDELSDTSDLDIIDNNLLETYKEDIGSREQDSMQMLKDNGLAAGKNDKILFTKGGVLLFAKNPAVVLRKKCSIKITHYFGKEASFTGEPNFLRRPFSIEGPLLYQIEKAVTYFNEVARSSPPKLMGATFAPTFLIPSWVFQEAVTNAVIHRNYSIEDDIQIRFFSDRVEVESPGTYPGHITISNIRKERFARNPMILRVLNRFAKAPNLDIGEGVDRMFEVMRETNLYEPLYVSPKNRPHSVLVVLWNMQRIEFWDVVNDYLEKNGRITNAVARKITGIKDTIKMSRTLKMWTQQGLIDKKGRGTSGTFYVKSGFDIPVNLLQR